MKKMMIYAMIFALLLSFGTVFAAAELPENIGFIPGGYSSDDADFSPVGDIAITWDLEASKKLDLTDGDLSDWVAAGYSTTNIGTENMVYWVKDTINGSGVPEGWNISAYFVADTDYLYIGFDVTDPSFAYGTAGQSYNGDAIQISIDFGGKMGDQLATDPDVLFNHKNVFYSFSCVSDGAPLEIMLQESDQDRMLSETNGDGVKGCAFAAENGWRVEMALSFDMMWDHYKWKDWDDDAYVYVGSNERLPLKIGCCLYYLDRSEPDGTINWGAGTTNGIVDDAGVPQVCWLSYDNGINLILEYREGMTFASNGIVVIPPSSETEAPYDTDVEWPTEIATEEIIFEEITEVQALPPVWDETLRDAAEDDTLDDELNAILEKYGCTAVIGMGSLTALLTLAAAAFVLKKK